MGMTDIQFGVGAHPNLSICAFWEATSRFQNNHALPVARSVLFVNSHQQISIPHRDQNASLL